MAGVDPRDLMIRKSVIEWSIMSNQHSIANEIEPARSRSAKTARLFSPSRS